MENRNYRIFPTAADMNGIPVERRFLGLVCYVTNEDAFYRPAVGSFEFKPVDETQLVEVTIVDFVNMTIKHNLNSETLLVTFQDENKNHIPITYHLGNGFGTDSDKANTLTVTSEFPVRNPIRVRIVKL